MLWLLLWLYGQYGQGSFSQIQNPAFFLSPPLDLRKAASHAVLMPLRASNVPPNVPPVCPTYHPTYHPTYLQTYPRKRRLRWTQSDTLLAPIAVGCLSFQSARPLSARLFDLVGVGFLPRPDALPFLFGAAGISHISVHPFLLNAILTPTLAAVLVPAIQAEQDDVLLFVARVADFPDTFLPSIEPMRLARGGLQVATVIAPRQLVRLTCQLGNVISVKVAPLVLAQTAVAFEPVGPNAPAVLFGLRQALENFARVGIGELTGAHFSAQRGARGACGYSRETSPCSRDSTSVALRPGTRGIEESPDRSSGFDRILRPAEFVRNPSIASIRRTLVCPLSFAYLYTGTALVLNRRAFV